MCIRCRLVVGVTMLAVGLVVTSGSGQVISGTVPGVPQAVRDRRPEIRTGTAVLHGRVVDGSTGQALPRARVRLMGPGGARSPVVTDSAGTFVFSNLPAGPYSVAAEKSTYLPGTYPDRGRSLRASATSALVLREGQTIDAVTVALYRGGAIVGRVVDAYGDPVEYVQIAARRLGAFGGTQPSMRGGASTNDLGEFRVARLQPGQYILSAIFQRRGGWDENPDFKPAPQPLPTFYPDVLSVTEAQPITVERGQTISGIEIVMAEGVPTVVTGAVVTTDGQPVSTKGGGGGSISVRLAGRQFDEHWFGGGTGLRPDGTFRMLLPPGDYILEAEVFDPPAPGKEPDYETRRMGMTRLSVAGDSLDVAIPVGHGATAAGRIVFEGAAPPITPPGRTAAPLFGPNGSRCHPGRLQLAPDWSFKIEGLFGTCSAPPMSMFGRWTLKSATVEGRDITKETLTFHPGQHYRDVQIVMTDRRSELTLRVSDEQGQTTREYVALVFPADRSTWDGPGFYPRTFVPRPPALIEALQQAGAGPRGSNPAFDPAREVLSGLTPGDYHAIAVDDIDQESTRDPSVLERLAPSATRVMIGEGASEVALRRLRLADLLR